jgi:hypothetical protein
MADTKISALTDGATADATDRIPVARSPFASGDNRYVTPAYIRTYMLGLANTWLATQTITPAVNTNALAVTGYSLTGSDAQSLIDLAGTWNTTGTPTALKLNITNTASNAASPLMDLQVGGTSRFKVLANDYLTVPNGNGLFNASQNGGLYLGSGDVRLYVKSTPDFAISNSGRRARFASDMVFGWADSTGADGSLDVSLARDAANALAQRTDLNAQTFRTYFSFSNSSNYTRLAFKTATTLHTIETESAGTGEANIDLALTSKGTGRVRYGTHSAIAAETVTGYITIKDSGGTERKLAVIS